MARSKRWIDVLPSIVAAYNNSVHSALKRTPASVTSANEEEVYAQLYGSKPAVVTHTRKFKVGDKIRIKRRKTIMDKSYTKTFSDEPYIVTKQLPGRRYTIEGDNGIKGIYYEYELVPFGTEEPRRQ